MSNKAATQRDLQSCLKLVEECREQWDDPLSWQDHLTTGIEKLVGGFGSIFTVTKLDSAEPETVEALMSKRNTADVKEMFTRVFNNGGLKLMPSSGWVFSNLSKDGKCTWSEQAAVGRHKYHQSDFYQRYQRDAFVSDVLFNASISDRNEAIGIGLLRSSHDREFSSRELSLLAFIGDAVTEGTRRVLRLSHQHGRHMLTPRQRETLGYLLGSHSEKQIAQLLGISAATVHDHIGAIYRAYGVSRRVELMAAYIERRIPKSAPPLQPTSGVQITA